MCRFVPPALGWHRDLPDPRDLTPKHDIVIRMLRDLNAPATRADQADLREYCGGILSQQPLAASSVHACLSMVRYFERRTRGRVVEPSRLFVYRAARRLLGWSGDSGLPLRMTLRALLRFGMSPEALWPFDPSRLDDDPDAFIYASADHLDDALYVRLDIRGIGGEDTLETVRRFLSAGFVVVCGFPVPTSVTCEAEIPLPTIYDGIRGGQAVLLVGYDDKRRDRSDRGALLFANSWGREWGDQGYGWLPYAYVREQLAVDFWTLLMPGWLVSGELQRPG